MCVNVCVCLCVCACVCVCYLFLKASVTSVLSHLSPAQLSNCEFLVLVRNDPHERHTDTHTHTHTLIHTHTFFLIFFSTSWDEPEGKRI